MSAPDREFWTYDQADRIYRSDPLFRRLVDGMYVVIDQLRLTPGEIRSAATYASVKWEMRHRRPISIPVDSLDPEILAQVREETTKS